MPTVEPDDLQDITAGTIATNPESREMTIKELWEAVQLQEDIIIEIDAIEINRVRKGLSGAKAKENAKLRDNNLPTDDSVLEFKEHDDVDLKRQGRVKLQIWLKRPDKIKIHKYVVADGEL